jgi:hypothetical protein
MGAGKNLGGRLLKTAQMQGASFDVAQDPEVLEGSVEW